MAEIKIDSRSKYISGYKSFGAFMFVDIHYSEGSLTDDDLEKIAMSYFKESENKMKKDKTSFPLQFRKRDYFDDYVVIYGVGYREDSFFENLMSDDAIYAFAKAGILLFEPDIGIFRIAPKAKEKDVNGLGYERSDLYNSKYVEFLRPQRGNVQLNRYNCESSLP